MEQLPPSAFDSLGSLVAQVQLLRERELSIETAPETQPGAPSGLWLHESNGDRIVVSSGMSVTHRRHIILHELGHMLLDHTSECGYAAGLGEAAETPFEVLDPRLVTFMLPRPTFVRRRQSYRSPGETEAEIFATMAGVRLLRSRRPDADETAITLQRLDDSFHSRWPRA